MKWRMRWKGETWISKQEAVGNFIWGQETWEYLVSETSKMNFIGGFKDEFDFFYPEKLGRWSNIIFFKWVGSLNHQLGIWFCLDLKKRGDEIHGFFFFFGEWHDVKFVKKRLFLGGWKSSINESKCLGFVWIWWLFTDTMGFITIKQSFDRTFFWFTFSIRI